MNNLTEEKLIPLSDVCGLVPGSRGAKRLHRQTVARWIEKGVIAKSGQRVKLGATRVGNRWLTTAEAVERFFALLAEMPEACDARLDAEHERDIESAGRELDAMGA